MTLLVMLSQGSPDLNKHTTTKHTAMNEEYHKAERHDLTRFVGLSLYVHRSIRNKWRLS